MPGASSRTLHQARWETGLLMRNGEQLLLTIAIPIGILLVLAMTDFLPGDGSSNGSERLAQSLAVVLAVSVISAGFTSLAIATAFERRSGALRFLGTTPLTRRELLGGKLLATLAVTAVSVLVTVATALILGWRPSPSAWWMLPLLVLGVAAWVPWGLALGGALRAEAVLALANGAFLVILMFGGVVIPSSSLPGPLSQLVGYLPSGALVDGLSAALVVGSVQVAPLLILAAWAIAGTLVATRVFRWS